ncbi:MAG: response regulator [Firmicutes bacterium]|nr:response regulator [Bacillota bacterium]
MKGTPIDILLVEDDQGDIELTREALKDSKLNINLHVARDGVEALAFLRKQQPFEKAVRPDLILLDINMPRKNGRETLQEIRSDEELKSIPVVVLTSSNSDEDITKSYEIGANCYITKPVGFDQFVKVVKTIEKFWFTIVKLPSR